MRSKRMIRYHQFNRIVFILLILLVWSVSGLSQERMVRWKRRPSPKKAELQLFHSTQAINLPTTESLRRGDFEFEISHRFVPPITDGIDALYGLDGPVNMRLALGYAPTNRTIITLARSNTNDNIDLWLKQKFFQIRNKWLPTVVSLRAGVAWNTGVIAGRSKSDARNFQYYVQAIFNSMVRKKLGIGIVPSYLYNSHIFCEETQYSFTIGGYIQYYVSPLWSIVWEWNPTITGWRQYHNPVAFGIELETGGHFFKIILTNSPFLNPSQFLVGSDLAFNDGDWRIGFNITRLLKFGK